MGSAMDTGPGWMDHRCGHNYPIAECVAEICDARRHMLEAAELRVRLKEVELERDLYRESARSREGEIQCIRAAYYEVLGRAEKSEKERDLYEGISAEMSHCASQADADTARLEYYFSPGCRLDINGYMQGVREGWTVDQWRAYIDAAMQGRP
jgi:hypothetical protein